MGQVQETEDAEPVRDGNDDYIGVFRDEVLKIIPRVSRSANLKTAAVNPYHDRLLLHGHIIGLPYIQVQAIFSLNVSCGVFYLSLGSAFPIVIGFVHAFVRGNVHGRLPTQIADGLLADKGNAPKHNCIVRLPANKGAVDALDSQRFVIIAVCDLLVLAVLRPRNLFQLAHDFRMFFC